MTNFEIEVGKQKFAFNIGVIFLGKYLKSSETDLDTLFKELEQNPLSLIPELMYASALYKTPGLKITKDKFFDLIDSEGLTMPSISEFSKRFTESLTQGVPSEEVEEESDAKKK